MIHTLRDKTVSKCAAYLFNARIKEFGNLLAFELNSKKRTIEMEIILKGETEPLHVLIRNYKIIQEGEKSFITAEQIDTSREWINTAVERYSKKLHLEIPAEYAKIAAMLI